MITLFCAQSDHAAHDGVVSISAEVTESSVRFEDEHWAVHDHQEPSLPLNLSNHSMSRVALSNPRDVGTFVDLSGDFCELITMERHRPHSH
jgi:hypothetical protein